MAGGTITRVYTANTGGRRQRKLNNRQVKQVQKIINSNKLLKVFYTAMPGGIASATPQLIPLDSVTKGDEFFQRDSDRINVQSLKLTLGIYNTAAAVNTIRIIVLRSKVGPLVVGDLPAAINTVPDLDKMQVYEDRIYSFGTAGSAAFFNDQMFKSFKNKKVPHMKVGYDETVSATLAQDNPLYIYFLTLQDSIVVQGHARLKFFDRD